VIVNLKKAVQLFESKNKIEAAVSTRKILEDAIVKFGFNSKN
jgi:hypothetical protein